MAEEINIIVAIGLDGVIGKKGDLIWKISDDLKRFKKLTLGHPVIMGRKTWESLPKRPLPGRRNIILSRNPDFAPEGAEIADSVEKALQLTQGDEPFIMGGAEIYRSFLPFATKLHLTKVMDQCPDADSFLNIDLSDGWLMEEESDVATTPDGLKYQYLTYSRIPFFRSR